MRNDPGLAAGLRCFQRISAPARLSEPGPVGAVGKVGPRCMPRKRVNIPGSCGGAKCHSPVRTAKLIDSEVRSIIDQCYGTANDPDRYREKLEQGYALEYETI